MKKFFENTFIEFLSYIYITLPIITSWSVLYLILKSYIYLVVFSPIILTLVFSTAVWILRRPLATMKKGVFKVSLNRGYISWYLNLCLLRSLKSSGLDLMIRSMKWSRFITFRALGAKISYQSDIALNADLCDFPLLEIHENCFIADKAKLSAHYLTPQKLILRPIKLGRGTQISQDSIVTPGTITTPKDGENI